MSNPLPKVSKPAVLAAILAPPSNRPAPTPLTPNLPALPKRESKPPPALAAAAPLAPLPNKPPNLPPIPLAPRLPLPNKPPSRLPRPPNISPAPESLSLNESKASDTLSSPNRPAIPLELARLSFRSFILSLADCKASFFSASLSLAFLALSIALRLRKSRLLPLRIPSLSESPFTLLR